MVTILYATMPQTDVATLEAAATRHEADLVEAHEGALQEKILPALARGGVVVVVSDDNEASRALALGVDEVVRTNQLSTGALDYAVQRAMTRAEARVMRDYARNSSPEDEATAFKILTGAMRDDVNNPLQAASLELQSLSQGVEQLLETQRRLVEIALARATASERESIRTMLATVPPREEILDVLENVADCVSRATAAMRRFGALTDDIDENVDAGALVTELVALVSHEVDVDVEADVTGDTTVATPRSALVYAVGALLACALDAARTAKRRGTVAVHTIGEDDVVLVEIQHPGIGASGDLRPDLFTPHFGASRTLNSALHRVRERARSFGGELLLSGEDDRTTLRLVVPRPPSLADSEPRLRTPSRD